MHCSAELPPAAPHAHDSADVNGASVLYAYGNFRRNFSISAALTLPKIARNRGVFYADWIILIPRGKASQQFLLPFVQINLLRWSRFNYRQEVAFTWAGRDGKLIYADSSIFLDDRLPHTFGIAVSGPSLTMSVDHRTVCVAKTSDFFDFRLPLYFQLGDEVQRYGDRISGTLSHVMVKSDDDARPKSYVFTCMYRGRGLQWVETTPGTFAGEGTLAPINGARFTGRTPASKCIDLSLKHYPKIRHPS